MTALDDELRHVIRDAMSDSIDEKGTIHFDVASENILAAIRKVVQLKRLPPPAEAEVFTRLLASLAVDDPYTLISPIERSHRNLRRCQCSGCAQCPRCSMVG